MTRANPPIVAIRIRMKMPTIGLATEASRRSFNFRSEVILLLKFMHDDTRRQGSRWRIGRVAVQVRIFSVGKEPHKAA